MSIAQSFPSWFWTGSPSTRVASIPRDARVDLFRGIALIAIFVDHVAGNWASRLTPAAMGLSDAAEYFVLLAGFSAALAYGSVIDKRGFVTGSAQVVARIWKLYTAHLGLFVFTAVAVALMAVRFGNPLYYEHVALVPFFQDPANAIWQTAALVFLPNYLDILPLYIVLLAMAPMLWVLARVAPALALGVSVSLYAVAWSVDLAFPNLATGGVWFFNPFAWQLLFTIGLVSGHAALSGIALPRNAALLVVATGVVLLGLINSAPWVIIPGLESLALPDLWRIDPDKTNLSPWRLAHALSLAYLVARFVPRNAAWMKSAVGRALDDCGRQSLPLFCLGVILSLVGTVALFEISRDWPMQIAVNLVGIGLLLTAGRVLQWYRAATAKEPAPRNAVRDEVKAA